MHAKGNHRTTAFAVSTATLPCAGGTPAEDLPPAPWAGYRTDSASTRQDRRALRAAANEPSARQPRMGRGAWASVRGSGDAVVFSRLLRRTGIAVESFDRAAKIASTVAFIFCQTGRAMELLFPAAPSDWQTRILPSIGGMRGSYRALMPLIPSFSARASHRPRFFLT